VPLSHLTQRHAVCDTALAFSNSTSFLQCGRTPACFSTVLPPCFCAMRQCIFMKNQLHLSHRRSQGRPKGPWPPTFLENIVILCFERRFSKQNRVVRLISNILAPPQFFWPSPNFRAGYATDLSHTLIECENKFLNAAEQLQTTIRRRHLGQSE